MAQETSGGGAKGRALMERDVGIRMQGWRLFSPRLPCQAVRIARTAWQCAWGQNHKVYINCTLLSNSKHHFCHKIEKDIF